MRETIAGTVERGRLPADIGHILVSALPAAPAAVDEAMFDEPTVPLRSLSASNGPTPAALSPPSPGLPPMPVLPNGPQAAPPAFDEVRSKVDDVVLSALIGDYRGLRQGRPPEDSAPQKADALDGLLVNYKSARFRSDARRASRGDDRQGLELGKVDGFTGQRAGLGSILRDRFILDAEVGRGGMGIVYSAVDRRRLEAGSGDPYVALKLLNDEFRSNSDALRVLEAEARKSQSLAHPNIATVYDFDRDRSEIFIVMELLTGRPLSRHLAAAAGQPMPGGRIAVC